MDQDTLFAKLNTATNSDAVAKLLAEFEHENPSAKWIPVGRENNRGTIEASSNPGRSLIERITNGIDAVLEAENEKHNGVPDCRSPREAAQAWLGIPKGSLSELTTKERQTLADRVTIRLHDGDGDWSARLVAVVDQGTGLLPEEMPKTILSLSESNKITKRYVVGAYGQGGSSTFACSEYSFIASRHHSTNRVGFAVVKYYEPPPDDESKVGNYVYLTLDGAVMEVEVDPDLFPVGTQCLHFGYDLTRYKSALGPGSVYGLLNSVLFDPVVPVWLDSRIHKYRRVIKGSRNALNGAVDEGDANKKGPTLSHNVPMYHVDLGDHGSIGIEYWVIEPTEKEKQPIRAFVDNNKPIILTLHGQSHAEMSQVLVRKDAGLPYLRQRLICHVDCNKLKPGAKRSLFVSNREEARRGHVFTRIEEEVVRALTSDDDLARLDREARDKVLQRQDVEAQKQVQSEVARLLRLQGMNVELAGGGSGQAPGGGRPVGPRGPRPQPQPIPDNEPPTFIRILWDDDKPISFFPEQSRYLRIETDAESRYHDPSDSASSRVNVILSGSGLKVVGTTPLRGGRMRVIVRCSKDAQQGATGNFRVELSRQGLSTLHDSRSFEIVSPPPPRAPKKAVSVPRIDPRPIDPEHDQWATLGWPTNDPGFAASSSEMEEGTLVVWYSTIFPSYAKDFATLEGQDPAMAKSFGTRYSIWLAVHSLLLQEDEEEGESQITETTDGDGEIIAEDRERVERCRVAKMSAMIAHREVRELRSASMTAE